MPAVRVLVLGGYGLIGAAVTRRLLADGYGVTGLGRSLAKGRRAAPAADWVAADLRDLTAPESWAPHITGVDAVVNAAGALQDGAGDDLGAVRDSLVALIAACEAHEVRRFIQISAPGASGGSSTEFYRTKADADARLAESVLDWTIFRPGLVLGADTYGGSRLLRMLAAFPLIQPLALAEAQIRTVDLDDVAEAVARSLRDGVTGDFDLVEAGPRRLEDIVADIRAWLGFAPARMTLRLPSFATSFTGRLADGLGRLGWRSPLRSSAMQVLTEGVDGDPRPWADATGAPLKPLGGTLSSRAATWQDRIAARASLAFPPLLALLSLFWIASGAIGVMRLETAMAVFDGAVSRPVAIASVLGGAALDLMIGTGLAIRRWHRPALAASIAVAFAYLAGGAILTPWMWADPLGPMVKVFPAISLALALLAIGDER